MTCLFVVAVGTNVLFDKLNCTLSKNGVCGAKCDLQNRDKCVISIFCYFGCYRRAICSLKESLHCKVGIWNLKDDGMAFTGQTVLKKGAIKLHYGIILGTKGPDIPEHMRSAAEFLSQVA